MKKASVFILSIVLILLMSLPVPALASSVGEQSYTPLRSADTGYVNATNVNLRTGPGTSYPSLCKLAYGTVLEISDTCSAKTWYCVNVISGPYSGKSGYIYATYVTLYPN